MRFCAIGAGFGSKGCSGSFLGISFVIEVRGCNYEIRNGGNERLQRMTSDGSIIRRCNVQAGAYDACTDSIATLRPEGNKRFHY